jgi:putative membrane protein
MMGFGFGFMGIFWLLLIAGVIWLVSVAVKSGRTNSAAGAGLTARDILDQRYARGELTREQYEQMKQDLS